MQARSPGEGVEELPIGRSRRHYMTRTFRIKLGSREEGPFSEEQVAQLFADRKVTRETPCRLADGGEWKTVDDLLPILKYGTQLPSPTESAVVRSEDPAVYRSSSGYTPPVTASRPRPDSRVSLVDIDLPFLSIVKLLFKWAAAAALVAFCFIPAFIFLWIVLLAVLAVLGGMFAWLPHP